MENVQLPASWEAHQGNYKTGAFQDYTVQELGAWVHLFMKRATHRNNPAKAQKDLTDAQNYLDMIQAQLNALKDSILSE